MQSYLMKELLEKEMRRVDMNKNKKVPEGKQGLVLTVKRNHPVYIGEDIVINLNENPEKRQVSMYIETPIGMRVKRTKTLVEEVNQDD